MRMAIGTVIGERALDLGIAVDYATVASLVLPGAWRATAACEPRPPPASCPPASSR